MARRAIYRPERLIRWKFALKTIVLPIAFGAALGERSATLAKPNREKASRELSPEPISKPASATKRS
jgi:hypothetical protein